MSYIPPVVDRTSGDVSSRTAKAFFNLADWQRIYNNAEVTKALIDFLFETSITFNAVAAPTVTTIPKVSDLNTLLANINRILTASCLPALDGLNELREDWQEGSATESPDYLDVNEWEAVLDLIYTSVGKSADYFIHCGVAQTGQVRFYQNRFRS